MKKVSTTDLKTRCLSILETVRTTREPVLITERGKPVAKLMPVGEAPEFLGRLRAVVKVRGDVESTVGPPESWEVLR